MTGLRAPRSLAILLLVLVLVGVACSESTPPPSRQDTAGRTSTGTEVGTCNDTSAATSTHTASTCSSVQRQLFCVGTGARTETLAASNCTTATSTGNGSQVAFSCAVITGGCFQPTIASCATGLSQIVKGGKGAGTAPRRVRVPCS